MSQKRQIMTNDADMPSAFADDVGVPGVVSLSNEERFTAVNFSQALTEYAIGWTDPNNLQAELDMLAPPVPTARRFEYKSATNRESFFVDTKRDIRAIGGAFQRVEFKGTSVDARTINKGLTITLDRDEMVDGSQESAVRQLQNRLLRSELLRTVTLIAGAASNTGKTWDSSADPDTDILTDMVTGADARGFQSNLVAYGETAWNLRLTSFRAQDKAGQGASSSLTPQEAAVFAGADRGFVSRTRYQSGSANKTKMLGNYVFMYYADADISKDDPSNVKRFITPPEGGGTFRVFVDDSKMKTVDVSVEHYSLIAVTSSLGMRMFTVS